METQSWLKRVTSIIWGSLYGLLCGILVGTVLLIVGFVLYFVLTSVFLYMVNGEIVDIRELNPLTMFEIFNPLKWWEGNPWRMLKILIFATVVVLCLGKFKLGHLNSNEPLHGADLTPGSRASI